MLKTDAAPFEAMSRGTAQPQLSASVNNAQTPAPRPGFAQSISLWPREHGAWSLLLVPFLSAVVLARHANLFLLPTAIAGLAIFLLREPLIVIGRQRFVWRTPHTETQAAKRWVAVLSLVLALAGSSLLLRWPLAYWLAFGLIAMGWTAVAAWLAVKNQQRSLILQATSSIGLTATALAASLTLTGVIQTWALALWAAASLHALGAVFVVRALLEARMNARMPSPRPATLRRIALWGNLPLLIAAIALPFWGQWLIAAACAVEGIRHILILRRLDCHLDTPLRTIGLRAMAHSIGYTALVVAALW